MNPRILHVRDLPSGPWPGDAMYIGRPAPRRGLAGSMWANPYRMGAGVERATVIERFRSALEGSQDPQWKRMRTHLADLEGKRLVCWCSPQRCHGEVLLDWVAEREDRGPGSQPLQAQVKIPTATARYPQLCDACLNLIARGELIGNIEGWGWCCTTCIVSAEGA